MDDQPEPPTPPPTPPPSPPSPPGSNFDVNDSASSPPRSPDVNEEDSAPSLQPSTSDNVEGGSAPPQPRTFDNVQEGSAHPQPLISVNVQEGSAPPPSPPESNINKEEERSNSAFSRSVNLIAIFTVISLIIYLCLAMLVFLVNTEDFKMNNHDHHSNKIADGFYFVVVTLCSVGYGDIYPNSTLTKICVCILMLISMGWIQFTLNGLGKFMFEKLEEQFKGRAIKVKKICSYVAIILVCIGIGVIAACRLEKFTFLDSLYLSIASVTTVGYGDKSFSSIGGRGFAAVWLLLSTLVVDMAYSKLSEMVLEQMAEKVTEKELMAAGLVQDGRIRKSDFILYKLKKIRKGELPKIYREFENLEYEKVDDVSVEDSAGRVSMI